MNSLRLYILLSGVLMLGACNVTKHLPAGESLYAGSTVKVHTESKKKAKALRTELKALVRPKPNASILGFRYKLWIYYVAGEPKGKGLRNLIRKQGEPPVFASAVNLEKNRAVLENRLQNRGYFHAAVTVDSSSKKRMVTVHFDAVTDKQYKIRKIHFPSDTSHLGQEVAHSREETLLKEGDPYDLEVIKSERSRIDLWLKDRGYYYFNADFLLMQVDSTVGGSQVDMYLKVKNATPPNDRVVYFINNIYVYPTYTIDKDSLLGAAPAEKYHDYYIIDPEHRFKPNVFSRMLIFHPGDPYSRRDHNQSLNRLVNLGTFKFVKARFEEVDTAGNYLDPYYFLTPLPKKSWRAEVTGLTKSDNATGTEISLSWRNRNLMKGAELFTVSLFGGIENQIAGNQNVLTDRYGLEVNLYVPRVLAPFRLNTKSAFVSKTRINLRYEIYNRNTEYTLNSYRGSYGFLWKESIKTEHQLNVLNLNYVKPLNITDSFQHILDTDITLRRSIEPQFILGPSYNFNYYTLAQPNNKINNYYLNVNLEAPGNILGLISGNTFNSSKEGKFLNTPFSQYARIEVDFRHYLSLGGNKANMLASRFLGGAGFPYGNSDAMPFIKEFFAGGTNDIRAFRARSLGPGTYYVRNFKTSGIIPDQPGDIKLELNTELRGKLFSVINGALFVDAGNVWTQKDDPERPGSRFTNKFLDQVAVGAGAGIRVDISFLILRVDLATPIRKPYLVDGPAFVVDQIKFGSADWRKENLILNLAIGYPF